MSADASTPALLHNLHEPQDFYGVACSKSGGRSV
jgi:hypothetical protein